MRKLIAANFFRLWKSKIWWITELGMAVWSLFMFGMFINNTIQLGENWMQSNAHLYCLSVLLYIGAVIAVFTALFLGTEYSDGTCRNKLIVGHSRCTVYLANLLVVCIAGILFYCTHFIVSFVCIPFIGTEMYFFVAQPLLRFCYGIIIVLCFSALFTMLAMLDSSKTRCAVVSLLLSLALIISGIQIYKCVTMEETKMQMVQMEDGNFQRQVVPNPQYPTGGKRVVYECLDALLPTAQGLHVVGYEDVPEMRDVFCQVGLSCVVTISGVKIFRKKDIK